MAKALKVIQVIDLSIAKLAFNAGMSCAALEDAFIETAKEWDDNPTAKVKARQDALCLSVKVGREAAGFAAGGGIKLPRGVDWVQYAIAQREMKPAKRHADFPRHRNNAQAYVSYLLRTAFLPSADTRGKKRGTKAPGTKASKAKAPAPQKVKEERPLYDLARVPVFKPEDTADKAENWTCAALVLVEDAAASNATQFNGSKKLATALELVHKALATLKG